MINLKLVSDNVDWVKENYKFDFSNGECAHVDPEYRKVRDPHGNQIGNEIDDMYDGFVQLFQEVETGTLYGVKRYYGMQCEELAKVVSTSIDSDPKYPVVIYQRMVKRDA